ncbi:MAG: hypothetical protein ACYCYP_01390 [Leptospirales bacterium]
MRKSVRSLKDISFMASSRVFLWVLLGSAFLWNMGYGTLREAKAAEPALTVRILNVKNGARVKGGHLFLKIRVTPPPTRDHPVHLRVMVNGHLHSLITVTHQEEVVQLNNLPLGKAHIEFVPEKPNSPDLLGKSGEMDNASGLCDGTSGTLPGIPPGVSLMVLPR